MTAPAHNGRCVPHRHLAVGRIEHHVAGEPDGRQATIDDLRPVPEGTITVHAPGEPLHDDNVSRQCCVCRNPVTVVTE